MHNKDLFLGVDYFDEMIDAQEHGEPADTPRIARIMDHAVEAGMTAVCWRVSCGGTLTYPTKAGTPMRPDEPFLKVYNVGDTVGAVMRKIDPLRVAVDEGHKRGLKVYAYYTLFDECYFHANTGDRIESDFGRNHRHCYLKNMIDNWHIRGVLSFGYPEVREYFASLVREALSYNPDGIYLACARTHSGSNPIPVHGWWPQWTNPYLAYGYNAPDIERYRQQYGDEPPGRSPGDARPLDETPEEKNWNRVRGDAQTVFLREIRPMVRTAGIPLCVCFFPITYNGFNPGYHCRQMLGRYHIDWTTWCQEALIDAIRLNVDHRRVGYDDWKNASSQTYKFAQNRNVKVYIDCAMDHQIDQLENAPNPLPFRKADDPEMFYALQEDIIRKMLNTSANGIFFYEHCGNEDRGWKTIRQAITQ